MKKFVFALLTIGIITGLSQAQEIGVRFGDIVGNDVAVDFVFGSRGQRIHGDVSFGDGVGAEVLVDVVMRPLSGEAFYYYLGIGPFAWIGDPFRLGVSAELGLEYRFNSLPIAIGLDWRPALRVIDDTKFFADRFGLNIRFVF
jgi:hypothetical protein